MQNRSYLLKEQKRIAAMVTEKFRNYYLTGGTALVFYTGHRFSEDLDFFSQSYDKKTPEKIMAYIAKQTGFEYKLDDEQDDPKLIPMKVYSMALKAGEALKIDFVKDYANNIVPVKKGLHSMEDIYYRKLCAAIGMQEKQGEAGHILATGRQSVKDLFDIYYLSSEYKLLSDFFFEYFAYTKAKQLEAWYKGFDRTETKFALLDLAPKTDTSKIFKHLDGQILKQIPGKLLE